MNSNRCPECGGVANHLVTDINGKSYYRCMTGLTTFERDGERVSRVGHIVSCDTIIDNSGKKFTGTVAYATGNKVDTLAVTDGKERR